MPDPNYINSTAGHLLKDCERVLRTRYEIDDTVQQELRAFAEACANHTKFPVRPNEALHNVAVMQAIP